MTQTDTEVFDLLPVVRGRTLSITNVCLLTRARPCRGTVTLSAPGRAARRLRVARFGPSGRVLIRLSAQDRRRVERAGGVQVVIAAREGSAIPTTYRAAFTLVIGPGRGATARSGPR